MPAPYTSFVLLLFAAVAATVLGRSATTTDDRRIVGSAVAVGVALLALWPWWRYVPEGQTDTLVAVMTGASDLDGRNPRFISPPPMELLAWGLGRLGLPPGGLWVPAAVAGVVQSAALGLLALRMTGRLAAGLVVVGLLALDPQRLAWCHAGYHVMHPAALLAVAMLCAHAATGAAGARRWWLAAAAGLWIAAAGGLRIDALAWAPATVLPFLRAPRGVSLAAVAAASATVGVFAAVGLQGDLGGAGWSLSEAGRGLAAASASAVLLEPWTHPVGLACLALLTGVARDARLLGLGAGVVTGLVLEGTFLDLGERHLLPARGLLALGVALVVAQAGPRTRTPAWIATAGLGLALLVSAASMRARYHAPWPTGEAPPPHLASGPRLDDAALAEVGGGPCLHVAHNPGGLPTADPSRHRDPLHLLDPVRAAVDRAAHGCVLWIRDHDDRAWNEGVRAARSRRLARAWAWEPVGHGRAPDGRWIAVWRQGARRHPISALLAPSPGDHPAAACLAAAHGLCDWVEACGDATAGPFARVDACRPTFEARCAAGERIDPACAGLTARRCAEDRALAARCWGGPRP